MRMRKTKMHGEDELLRNRFCFRKHQKPNFDSNKFMEYLTSLTGGKQNMNTAKAISQDISGVAKAEHTGTHALPTWPCAPSRY